VSSSSPTQCVWEDSVSKFGLPCFRGRKPRIYDGNFPRKTGRDTSCRLGDEKCVAKNSKSCSEEDNQKPATAMDSPVAAATLL
jgi:hypothetical protein